MVKTLEVPGDKCLLMQMDNAFVLVVSMVQILVNSIHTLMSAATGACMNLFHCPPLDGHYGDGTACGWRTGCLLSLLVNKKIEGSVINMSHVSHQEEWSILLDET
jgi:hypothetical protein